MDLWAGAELHSTVYQHRCKLAVDDDHGGQGQGLDAAHYEPEEQPGDLAVSGESKEFQESNGLRGLQTLCRGRLLQGFTFAGRGGHLIPLHFDG